MLPFKKFGTVQHGTSRTFSGIGKLVAKSFGVGRYRFNENSITIDQRELSRH
jgi:hypothetical protein